MFKRLTLAIALLATLSVCGWLFLPYLAGNVVRQLAASKQIDVPVFELTRIGWHAAKLDHLTLRTRQSFGLLEAKLDGLELEYQPLSATLRAAKARQMALSLDLTRHGDNTADGAIDVPVLPRIDIDSLNFVLISDNGTFRFNGRFQVNTEGHATVLRLNDSGTTADLRYRKDRQELKLILHGADSSSPFVQLMFMLDQENIVAMSGESDMDRTLNWLHDSRWIPDNIRQQFADLQIADGDLKMQGDYSIDQWRGEVLMSCQGLALAGYSVDALIEAKVAATLDTVVTELSQTSRLTVSPIDETGAFERITAVIEPGYRARAVWADRTLKRLEGQGPGQLKLQLDGSAAIVAERPTWSTNGTLDRLQLELFRPTLEPQGLAARQLTASVVRDVAQTWLGSVTTTTVQFPTAPAAMPAIDLDAKFALVEEALEVEGRVAVNHDPIGTWRLRRTQGQHSLKARFGLDTAFLNGLLGPYLTGDALRLNTGEVSGEVNGTWRNEPQLQAQLRGSDLGGSYAGMEFEGIEFDAQFTDVFEPTLTLQTRGAQATLANGIALTGIEAGAEIDGQQLRVSKAHLSTLGGRVSLTPSQWAMADRRYTAKLNLEEIDLGELLRALDQDHLRGQGTLEGSLPITNSAGRYTIRNGVVFNSRPGTLQYDATQGKQEANLNNVALNALRDFRYNTLNSTINYAENGRYAIKIRLEGNNPELFDGYPIAFNINLEGQLDNIGRAILFGGELGGEILNRARIR